MRIGEAATGVAVSRRISGLVAGRPALAGWDWIQDVRESRGGVDNADISVVAEAFAGEQGACWTIFVSHDRNPGLWCKVMDAMFQWRRHLTALTPEVAIQLLDSLRAASPAPSSS